ncbi:MAG: ferredoxin family protein [Candidatus Bathyarchaeota archaeon]|jgi:2-oxoglutarate ferredoxin oxidoreductase subunit delta|nr:ferredoxin family protein [Candidatus Bathyarchaeota archaeon]
MVPQKFWRKPLDAQKIETPKAEVRIIPDLCKGCGFCIEFCPKKVLEESDQPNKRGAYPPRIVDESKCALCGFCTAICPDFAIFAVEKKHEASKSENKE